MLENGVKLGNKSYEPIQLLDYLLANASRELKEAGDHIQLPLPGKPLLLPRPAPYLPNHKVFWHEIPLVSPADMSCCVDVSQQSWE